VLVHGVQTRRGHAGSHAAEGLQAKAEVGARGLAATTGLDAAAALRTDVALAAQVLGHVVFQDRLASLACSAAGAEAGQSATRLAFAASIDQRDLELVGAISTQVTFNRSSRKTTHHDFKQKKKKLWFLY
jgi:hypothetical protein